MSGMRPDPVSATWLLALLLLLAGGCSQPDGKQKTSVTLLTYQEQEAGVEPYPLRILVNASYLRFDDGYDASDFMLMERDTQAVYSISHEDRSILALADYPAVDTTPAEILLTEERDTDAAAPEIAGKQPEYIRFLAGGELCSNAIVVPGLLDQAREALAEYATVLGNRQFSDMASVPEEMQTPCFLSRYVYAPARHLRDGLPISEWDEAGYRRTLVDYREDERVDADLFELPQDYERYSPDG